MDIALNAACAKIPIVNVINSYSNPKPNWQMKLTSANHLAHKHVEMYKGYVRCHCDACPHVIDK